MAAESEPTSVGLQSPDKIEEDPRVSFFRVLQEGMLDKLPIKNGYL